MKNTIYSLVLLVLFACDAPQTTRRAPADYLNNASTYTNGTNNFVDPGDGIGDGTDGSGNDIIDPIITSDPGFENCDLGIQYNASSIGNFGVCQSTQDETKFKAIFGSTDTSVGTCFVPVHISGATSFKLGIAQCVHNVASKSYDFTLSKQRAEPLNGIMVIKASSLNSYMQCMNAKANYINSVPGCAYNQSCVNAATNYANQICSSFISYHSSHYKQVAF